MPTKLLQCCHGWYGKQRVKASAVGGSPRSVSRSCSMLARFVSGALVAGAIVGTGNGRSDHECRRGPSGSSRARFSPSAASMARAAPAGCSRTAASSGAVQFSGSGPVRHISCRAIRSRCAVRPFAHQSRASRSSHASTSTRVSDRSFRGSVSGMGFAYCDFNHQGGKQMLLARSTARPHRMRQGLRAPPDTASKTEVDRAGRDPAGRELQARPRQAGSEGRAGQGRRRFGTSPLHRLMSAGRVELCRLDRFMIARLCTAQNSQP